MIIVGLLILIVLLMLLGRRGFLWLVLAIVFLPFFFLDQRYANNLAKSIENVNQLVEAAPNILAIMVVIGVLIASVAIIADAAMTKKNSNNPSR